VIDWAKVRAECSHNGSRYFKRNGYEVSVCTLCHFACSLGPSNDASEAVQWEIRAAELATKHAPTDGETFDVRNGWYFHRDGYSPDATWSDHLAGWLAREIATHDDTSKEGA
jgi:hypothetical protein